MKKLFLISILFLLCSCQSITPEGQIRTLLDRLEFEGDEYGSFELEGTVDINPLPLFSTNVHIKLEKHKDPENDEAL